MKIQRKRRQLMSWCAIKEPGGLLGLQALMNSDYGAIRRLLRRAADCDSASSRNGDSVVVCVDHGSVTRIQIAAENRI